MIKPIKPSALSASQDHEACHSARWTAALEKWNDTTYVMAQYRSAYENTNDPDPGAPIAALCEAVKAAGDAESVTVPAWAARALAEGFNRFFKSELLGTRSMSLEQCFGIKKAAKGSSSCAMFSAEDMVTQVHGVRWHFERINIGLACRVVYDGYVEVCNVLGLPSERMGITQSEESFQQHYERHHAKQFESWKVSAEAQGYTPTDERRDRMLSAFPYDLARKVVRENKK